MDTKTILAGVQTALNIAGTVATMLGDAGVPIAGAVGTAVKIATGVAAEVPEAQALWAQFNSGTIPSADEIRAYEADEDGAYAKLMADLNKA